MHRCKFGGGVFLAVLCVLGGVRVAGRRLGGRAHFLTPSSGPTTSRTKTDDRGLCSHTVGGPLVRSWGRWCHRQHVASWCQHGLLLNLSPLTRPPCLTPQTYPCPCVSWFAGQHQVSATPGGLGPLATHILCVGLVIWSCLATEILVEFLLFAVGCWCCCCLYCGGGDGMIRTLGFELGFKTKSVCDSRRIDTSIELTCLLTY